MRASDVRAAIAAAYRQPEWATFFEVADGTGAAKRRSADAVTVNMWPSRGLTINGFEIKVDRSDWRRELADPEKAESIAQYCEFWWVAAPKGLIDPATLPKGWGLTEVDDKGALRIKVQAAERKAKEPTRAFFAALCRAKAGADEKMIDSLVDKKVSALREQDRENNQREIDRRTTAARELTQRHEVFSKALEKYGRLRNLSEDAIVEGLRMLNELGITDGWGPLRSLFGNVKTALRAIEAAEATINEKKEIKS